MVEESERLQPLSESQLETLEMAVSQYQGQLGPGAAQYLMGRGITEETALTFRLGVVDVPAPGHERYRGWLAIPYLDAAGRPVSVRFRCIESHEHVGHGKYASLAGDPPRLFNVGALLEDADELHITEGEFDAMILTQLGLCAVGVPGASLWRGYFPFLLDGVPSVRVWGDPDSAGGDFVRKVCGTVPQAVPVQLTLGDVSETFSALGGDGLLALGRECNGRR